MKKREKIKKAQKLYEKHLMKFCFESLNENLALKRIEKNIKLSKDLEKAKSSYEKTLKTLNN